MSISLNANFELLSAGLYLDARQQFNTIIEMKDFAETSIPDGFITYNKETQKHYVFNSSNTVDATLGKWREYNSGDSSSTTYATWDSNVDYKVGNVVLKDEVRYSCIADHTSTDFETDSINWVVVLEQYYHVTQEQYNKMVSDGLITDTTKDLYIIDGNSEGGSSSSASYTTLEALGLTADASIDDVIGALKDGECFIGDTSLFTNVLTMFPNDDEQDQFAVVRIEKQSSSMVILEWFRKDGTTYAIGGLDNNGEFNGWTKLLTGNITTIIKHDSTDTQIPTAKTVYNHIYGTIWNNDSTEKDALRLTAGVYRILSNSQATGLINLPEKVSGILTIKSLTGNDLTTPYTTEYKYHYAEFITNKGVKYSRAYNSGATAGTIANDSGWIKNEVDLTDINTRLAELETKANLIPVTGDNPTDYDLNNYKENGNYSIGDSSKYNNVPLPASGLLTIMRSNSYRLQVYTVIGNNNVYFRKSADGGSTWSSWVLLNDLTDVNTRLAELENKQINNSYISNQVQEECYAKITIGNIETFSKILVTDIYGGCILITGSTVTAYKSFKAVRLSNGSWTDYSPSINTQNKIQNVYFDDSFIYIKSANYNALYIEGALNTERISSLPSNVTQLPILDLTQVSNNDTRITQLETEVSELFQSVSDGKTLVANAITDKGVSTSTTATFATMASNIRNLNNGIGYTSESKNGSVSVERGGTGSIRITFSNTVLGVTGVSYSWSDAHLGYRGFSVSGNTVTVKIELSDTYANSSRTISCTVSANIRT